MKKQIINILHAPLQRLLQLNWHYVSLLPGLCISRRCVQTPFPLGSPHGSGRMRGNAGAWVAAVNKHSRICKKAIYYYVQSHIILVQIINRDSKRVLQV